MSLIRRHRSFYFPDGVYVFQVENILFKLHSSILCDVSHTFRRMFSTHGGGEADGASDDKPIVLKQTRGDVFELFLCICYGRWRPDQASDESVVELLHMSDFYMSDRVREFAIEHIQNRQFHYKPARLVSLALRYKSRTLFVPAFRRLVPLRLNSTTLDERSTISPAVWAALCDVKELLSEHRSIVACEEPPIVHALGCSNPDKCAADWHQLWWNGMGRFLLDGRNPQPYRNAVERFEKVTIGQMSDDCWNGMLQIVKGRAAFNHEDLLVTETANELATSQIFEPVYASDDDAAMA